MNNYNEESIIENFYIIRVREDDELLRGNRLGELENILNGDERAKVEHVIKPISAVVAFLYDKSLVDELENRGYELLPQKNVKMIEADTEKEI